MIRDIQDYWNGQEKPRIKKVAEAFGIAPPTAKKYIFMTQEDIDSPGHPANYKKRESSMNAWLNIIYKMMLDGCSNETIYFYIKRQQDYKESDKNLQNIFTLSEKTTFRTDPRLTPKQQWNGCCHPEWP